eukprot:s839_g33.t1
MVELPLPADFPTWKSRHLAHSYRFALPACPSSKATPHIAVGAARFLLASEEDVVGFEERLQQDPSLLDGAHVNRGDKFLCRSSGEPADATAEIGIPSVPAVPAVAPDPEPVKKAVVPAPEFGSFTVEVSTKGFKSLGLKLDGVAQGTGHLIMEVESGGAIAAFNEETPTQSLRVYDVIMAVEGVKGFDDIHAKLAKTLPETVTLLMSRPQKVQVTLKKTGPLGIKMDYKESSMGCVISELNASGLLAKWNTENPGQRADVSDRIVEFAGKPVKGGELLEKLKKEDTLPLTVLKY